jgi:predicted kinase
MVGLPASGKDYWIQDFLKYSKEKYTVLSSDKIREELYGDEATQGNPNEVFNLLHKRLKQSLLRGENVIYNATNTRVKNRKPALDIVKSFKDYIIYAEIMATTLQQCYHNNERRERQVPQGVIKNMYMNWEPPHYFEGFNRIEINYPFIKPYIQYSDSLKEMKKISHDNPWHEFSIGTHISIAAKNCKKDLKSNKIYVLGKENPLEDYYRNVLLWGIKLHDIGKPLTKEFKDSKGNPSEVAHFYHHENVGAYQYMFYLCEKDYYDLFHPEYDSNIAAAIAYHMRPFNWKEPKTAEKYKNLWGYKLFNVINLLHYYDEAAEKEKING